VRFFLAGMRTTPNDPFRYLRIPADEHGGLKEWMMLRAALEDPTLRAQAAHRFAQRSIVDSNPELRTHLEESAARVLTLFAGADASAAGAAPGQPAGGFQSIAAFIDRSVPKNEQAKAASLLLRMLEGSTWDLWQLARERAGESDAQPTANASRFVQNSINALSDSFLYGSPVYLQLDSFKQVQASVFQLTRAPGKNLVYLGSLLLVIGIFSMFYVRERRLWFWLKDAGNEGAATSVVMAMSTARKTLDFEKEFVQVRDAIGAALGAAAHDAASAREMAHPSAEHRPAAATIESTSGSQD
jgi:cytochrome c biogenesis protein